MINIDIRSKEVFQRLNREDFETCLRECLWVKTVCSNYDEWTPPTSRSTIIRVPHEGVADYALRMKDAVSVMAEHYNISQLEALGLLGHFLTEESVYSHHGRKLHQTIKDWKASLKGDRKVSYDEATREIGSIVDGFVRNVEADLEKVKG